MPSEPQAPPPRPRKAPEERAKTLSVTMPPDLADVLAVVAQRHSRGKASAVVREALLFWLEAHYPRLKAEAPELFAARLDIGTWPGWMR